MEVYLMDFSKIAKELKGNIKVKNILMKEHLKMICFSKVKSIIRMEIAITALSKIIKRKDTEKNICQSTK